MIFTVCRTKDLFLASKIGRNSSGSSGGLKERPRLNLTVKREMGGQIMAQSKMAKVSFVFKFRISSDSLCHYLSRIFYSCCVRVPMELVVLLLDGPNASLLLQRYLFLPLLRSLLLLNRQNMKRSAMVFELVRWSDELPYFLA